MKRILLTFAILAVCFLTSGADDEDDTRRKDGLQFASCAERCVIDGRMASKQFDELIEEIRKRSLKFLDWYIDGNSPSDIVLDIALGGWRSFCTMWKALHQCVQNCGNITLLTSMHNMLASIFMEAASDFSCDPGIQRHFQCLTRVAQEAVPACDSRCEEYRTESTRSVKTYRRGGSKEEVSEKKNRFIMLTDFSKSFCRFLNCQLQCHNSQVAEECGEEAVEAAIKGVNALGRMAEVAYIAYTMTLSGSMPPYAPECTSDQLVSGFRAATTEIDDQEDNDNGHCEL